MNYDDENRIVAKIAEIFALERGYSSAKAKQIGIAAALHDIGKLKISRKLLEKPGKLSKEEFEIVKSHTKLGAEMLLSMQGELGEMARAVCLWHHEKWDGSGYWGMNAIELPDYLPIVSISDVFVACCSARPYKPAWPPSEVFDYIHSQAGTQFSHELVDAFMPLIRSDSRVSAIFNKR